MRAVPANKISHLSPKVTPVQESPKEKEDPLVSAVKSLPSMIAGILKGMPAPVIAPRPPGMWVIDVSRDKDGQMSQMTANFHEKKP